jgi:hypothetical protein
MRAAQEGRVLRGVPVFRALYAAVGLGWLYAATSWAPVAALADRVCVVKTAPKLRQNEPRLRADCVCVCAADVASCVCLRRYGFWAKRRLALTGRPGMEEVLAARAAAAAAAARGGRVGCDDACERPSAEQAEAEAEAKAQAGGSGAQRQAQR